LQVLTHFIDQQRKSDAPPTIGTGEATQTTPNPKAQSALDDEYGQSLHASQLGAK